MVKYESRKKRWISEPKMLVIALCVLICVPSTKGISIEFDDRSVDHWEFLFGANSKEFHYDFCKYNGTSRGFQCKSFLKPAFLDFKKRCNCIIRRNETKEGSLSVDVNCKSELSCCPEELTVTYKQGSFARAPPYVAIDNGIGENNIESTGNPPGSGTGADPDVATTGNDWLVPFIISSAFAVLFFITTIACLMKKCLPF
ncbi:uncharacterized protein LOC135943186 [Cloeon dipterum]|uniref:uncharacterized protein LOC135943186 n=1 Tax=Cloeon dipterum TaxID=197152 RepID=UPI0032204DB6